MPADKKYKIVVFALSGIGDALMFTPALKVLRDNLPSAQIDVITMYRGSEEIMKSTGLADRVIRFDFLNAGAFKSLLFMSSLFGRYTHSINVYPSNRKEYNIISFLTLAKHRGAVEYIRANKSNLGFLNTVTIAESDARHNVQTNIDLVKKMFDINCAETPDLIFNPSAGSVEWADNYYKQNISRGDSALVVGMHPGCSTLKNHIMRRWEPEKFALLAEQLVKKYNARVLLFGGPEEDELKAQIKGMTSSTELKIVSSPSLSASAALIAKCNFFVTNDSSLMHVASAMKVRTLAIIGPTNTNYIYPWNTEHIIASLNLECAPCFFYSPKPLSCSREDVQYKCIRELTPGLVENKLEKWLR